MVTMTTRLYSTFVDNVRERMADLELSQKQLAAKMDVTPSYVSQILSGHRRPGFESLDAFAEALDVRPEDLISEMAKAV